MPLKTLATITGINSRFIDYLVPSEDFRDYGNKNIRWFGFSTSRLLSDPETDPSIKEHYHTLIDEVCTEGHRKVDDGITHCHEIFKKNGKELPKYNRESIVNLTSYFPDKDKADPIEVEVLWDSDLVWCTLELISKCQYVYAITKYGKHLKIIKSREEKNYLERLYYRPFGRIFVEAGKFLKAKKSN